MNPLKVGLVGLGQIAAGYGSPGEAAPYCHVGGLMQSDKVQLAAVTDPFPAAHSSFQEKWGAVVQQHSGPVAHYNDATAMLAAEKLDIIGVCVRGPMHFEMVRTLLLSDHRPRAIFLEKPPFCSLTEADEIIALAAERRVSIIVSYSRHWAPHVLRLQELVRDGLIGRVHTVAGYAGGAVLSFTSHTTDLICQFACAQIDAYCPKAVIANGVIEQEVPASFLQRGYEAEPSIRNAFIEFENGVTGFQAAANGEHGGFYVDVFGESGQVRAGMYVAPAAWDNRGQAIDLSAYPFPEDTSVFRVAYDQIATFLNGGPLPACAEWDWQQVNEIGFAIIESIHDGGRIALPNLQRTRRIFANG